MGLTVYVLGANSGWQIHVHVVFNGCLRVRQYKIPLSVGPAVEDDQQKDHLYGHPSEDMYVRLELIHGLFLFLSVDMESGLVFVYFARIDVTFAYHFPHRGKDFRVL